MQESIVSVLSNKDHVDDLKNVSVPYNVNQYKNFEIIIIENNSRDKATF